MCYIQKWVKTVPIKVTVAQHAFWCARGVVVVVVQLWKWLRSALHSLSLHIKRANMYVFVYFSQCLLCGLFALSGAHGLPVHL